MKVGIEGAKGAGLIRMHGQITTCKKCKWLCEIHTQVMKAARDAGRNEVKTTDGCTNPACKQKREGADQEWGVRTRSAQKWHVKRAAANQSKMAEAIEGGSKVLLERPTRATQVRAKPVEEKMMTAILKTAKARSAKVGKRA